MGSSSQRAGDQLRRDQEVLRATRELAAYFRGRRTEREARGAVKIIKAFIREREDMDPAKRPPLPIGKAVRAPADKTALKTRRRAKARRRTTADGPQDTAQTAAPTSERPSGD